MDAKMLPEGTPGAGLQRGILDLLGMSIITGELTPGTLLNMDTLAQDLDVSRSVIREAVSVLSTLGLVKSIRRKGTTVLERRYWNALDSKIIEWRLTDPNQREAQLRSLVELRIAVEPHAAVLAAQRATSDVAVELLHLAESMYRAGHEGDLETFMRCDVDFHKLIVMASGNPLFASLDMTLSETLAGKHRLGLMPIRPDETAMKRHIDLAREIARGNQKAAYKYAVYIVDQSARELNLATGAKPVLEPRTLTSL